MIWPFIIIKHGQNRAGYGLWDVEFEIFAIRDVELAGYYWKLGKWLYPVLLSYELNEPNIEWNFEVRIPPSNIFIGHLYDMRPKGEKRVTLNWLNENMNSPEFKDDFLMYFM